MKPAAILALLLLAVTFGLACAPAGVQPSVGSTPSGPVAQEDTSSGPPAVTPGQTSQPTSVAAPPPTPAVSDRPLFSTSDFRTDFSRHSVPFSEIMSGGPPKDGIPAIDKPRFVPVGEADTWLKPNEPVVVFEHRRDARAYPLQILIWHEIVNDTVGGLPVAITFCPLCNTAIAFDRRLEGRVLDFGTTGKLRHSDLVMYDRQTETWWQQATGEAIVGELTGRKLTFLPAQVVSWRDFKDAFPRGVVLSRETGFARDYGRNPYSGYDDVSQSPFLFRGPIDKRLPPMERVVAVSLGGQDVAYPFRALRELRVVNDTVGGKPLVVFHAPGTSSALDQEQIAASRDVGATGVFDPTVDGRRLTFKLEGQQIVDEQTGSVWNVLGRAVAGQLVGKQLEPIWHGNHFWFAIAAFQPKVEVRPR